MGSRYVVVVVDLFHLLFLHPSSLVARGFLLQLTAILYRSLPRSPYPLSQEVLLQSLHHRLSPRTQRKINLKSSQSSCSHPIPLRSRRRASQETPCLGVDRCRYRWTLRRRLDRREDRLERLRSRRLDFGRSESFFLSSLLLPKTSHHFH